MTVFLESGNHRVSEASLCSQSSNNHCYSTYITFGSSKLDGLAAVEVAAEPLDVLGVHLVEGLSEVPLEGLGHSLRLLLTPEVSPGSSG